MTQALKKVVVRHLVKVEDVNPDFVMKEVPDTSSYVATYHGGNYLMLVWTFLTRSFYRVKLPPTRLSDQHGGLSVPTADTSTTLRKLANAYINKFKLDENTHTFPHKPGIGSGNMYLLHMQFPSEGLPVPASALYFMLQCTLADTASVHLTVNKGMINVLINLRYMGPQVEWTCSAVNPEYNSYNWVMHRILDTLAFAYRRPHHALSFLMSNGCGSEDGMWSRCHDLLFSGHVAPSGSFWGQAVDSMDNMGYRNVDVKPLANLVKEENTDAALV